MLYTVSKNKLQFIFVSSYVSKESQSMSESCLWNFDRLSAFLILNDILCFTLSWSRTGRFRNTGRWSLRGKRRMPEDDGAVKFVHMWSKREGEAVELSSGNLVGRDMWGKKSRDCIVLKKWFVGGCVSCSNRLMLKSPEIIVWLSVKSSTVLSYPIKK